MPLVAAWEQVVLLPLPAGFPVDTLDAFRRDLLQYPGILDVTTLSSIPTKSEHVATVRLGEPASQEALSAHLFFVDYDFATVLGLELLAGRSFARDFASDAGDVIIVNEALATHWGETAFDLIGKRLTLAEEGQPEQKAVVIGIIEDVQRCPDEEVLPAVFTISPRAFRYCAVRIHPDDIPNTVAFIEKTWQAFAPDTPFAYSFLADAVVE
ncbi:MAG: ABC transporter permease [Rhodothermales bacterium]